LENIRVLGYLADSDYKGVLNDSDVGIALYLRGSPVSMPTKVIDYINAGKPLIVSAINEEAAEVVRKNDIGFVVDSLDDLVFAIARYCDDRELIDRHRRNVLSLKSEFEPSRQVEKIIALVGELS
jgi:glycosyltransferase involved in cell wall biosynthesis